MTEPSASRQPPGSAPGQEAAVRVRATVAGTGDSGIAPTELPVVKIASQADLVNLVPYVLGFRPGDRDLVVIGVVPPRGRVKLTFRYDLPCSAGQARRAVAALAVDGNGALANVALDQALAANPRYSMAHLLREAIGCGAPPSKADPATIRREARAEMRRLRAQPGLAEQGN